MDISTRCGQDSDCNPASAAGILGTIIGYSNIPEYWKKNLREVEDMNFAYTSISLNKACQMSFNQALKMIERNGGRVNENDVAIAYQQPKPVRFEKNFEGHFPVGKIYMHKPINDVNEISFEGIGIVFRGHIKSNDNDYVAKVEMYIDGQLVETANLPASYTTRRYELFWKYQLPKGKHVATFKWLNPVSGSSVYFEEALIYSDDFRYANHQ